VVNSRIIRIAVSFCLIAAIVTQPIAIDAAQTLCQGSELPFSRDGSATSDSQHRCDGCGHCKVSSAGQLCGCCSGDKADEGESACCGETSSSGVTDREPDPIFGELSELVPKPGVPESESRVTARTTRSGMPVVARVCLCGLKPQPRTPITPRVPVSEESDGQLLAFDSCACARYDRNATRFLRDLSYDAQEQLLLDSQRHLCVWRL